MSVSRLRTEVRRLSKAWIPPGQIMVILAHACQTEAELEARARQALGREWRAQDVLILSTVEGPCPRGKHEHGDKVIIYARGG
jgi:hypothetical protein